MSKSKFQKKQRIAAARSGKIIGEKKPRRKFNWKLALILLGEFAVVFFIYQLVLSFGGAWIMWVYGAAVCGLFAAYVAVNRDITMDIPKEEQLPDEWSVTQKRDFIAATTARRKRAKPILMAILPFVITFMVDFIDLFYMDMIRNIFSGTGG